MVKYLLNLCSRQLLMPLATSCLLICGLSGYGQSSQINLPAGSPINFPETTWNLLDYFGKEKKGKTVVVNGSDMRTGATPISLPQKSEGFEPQIPGPGWMPSSKLDYTYDARGNRTARIHKNVLNQPFYKDSSLFDAHDNEIFSGYYEFQNNGWNLLNANRYFRTYNPDGKLTETIEESGYNGIWAKESRTITNYNVANYPLEETLYAWQNNTWEPEEKLVYSYSSIGNPPTGITFQVFYNGNWESIARRINNNWHNFEAQLYTNSEYQEWHNNTWQPVKKEVVVFDSFGGNVNHHYTWTGSTWENYVRITQTYDNRMNFTGEKFERLINNSWQKNSESLHDLTYNGSDQVIERVYRTFDLLTNSYNSFYKEIYSNFVVIYPAPAPDPSKPELRIGPNPAGSYLKLQTQGKQEIKAILTDMTGHVVLSNTLKAAEDSFLDLTSLKKGMYVLEVEMGDKRTFQKILKN